MGNINSSMRNDQVQLQSSELSSNNLFDDNENMKVSDANNAFNQSSNSISEASNKMMSSASAVSSSIAHNMKTAFSATLAMSSNLAPPLPFSTVSYAKESVIQSPPHIPSESPRGITPTNNISPTINNNSSQTSPVHISGSASNLLILPQEVVKVGSLLKVSQELNRTNLDSETMYGLNERVVAGESCWFATKVFSPIYPNSISSKQV
jgi:hypothetical protein